MATLILRKNGIWYLDYQYNGRRYRKSTKVRDRYLAEVRLHELELQLFRGNVDEKIAPRQHPKIAEFFLRYLNHIADNYARPECEQARLKRWWRFFRDKKIEHLGDIHAGLVQEFFSGELSNCADNTKRNYYNILRVCLNRAVEWRILDKNPVGRIRFPKQVRKFHFYSKAEISQLIEAAREPLRTAIILLVNTGLRRSELWNLRWRDVNLKKRQLTVMPHGAYKTKSRSLRTIPLNAASHDALARLKKDSDGAFVYRCQMPSAFTHQFHRLVVSLGMEGSLHTLRHTFASHLAMAGTPIPVIKELLGHSDISTTMIYAHLSPGVYKAELEKLRF